jgi:hypothetical protein
MVQPRGRPWRSRLSASCASWGVLVMGRVGACVRGRGDVCASHGYQSPLPVISIGNSRRSSSGCRISKRRMCARAFVRREEKLRRVSPEMKKGVPRVDEERASCTSGWRRSHGLGG